MEFRKATLEDIPELKALFEIGRQRQIDSGNLNQWHSGYPSIEQLTADINSNMSFVCLIEKEIIGAFFIMETPDPMYQYLREGMWVNENSYVTIHRFVVKYGQRGIGQSCLEWIKAQYHNIRIDTHRRNLPMKTLLERNGFVYCGQIMFNDFVRDGYQYVKEE